jgi:hypothetical protein
MKAKVAVFLFLALTALAVPAAAQELWLGVGGLVIPETGNAAYATMHQELQFSAGWLQPVSPRFALNFAFATDTVKAQQWAVDHRFADGPAAAWSARYSVVDAEAHYLLTPGSKCAVSAFLGASLYHQRDHDWGGYKAGLLLRYTFGEHFTTGLEVAARHAQAGPYGVYTVGEVALRAGWRF